MKSLLQRVHLAVPQIADWIDELLAAHLQASTPTSQAVHWTQAGWFPRPILDEARVAMVTRTPVCFRPDPRREEQVRDLDDQET